MSEAIAKRIAEYRRSFSFVGLVVATLFFAASVTPSLLPRHYAVQGLLSGFAIASGYAVGVLTVVLYLFLGLREPSGKTQRIAKQVTAVVVAAVFIAFIWRMTFWQNSIRQMMELELLETAYPYRVGLIAILFAAAVVAIGRLFIASCTYVARKLDRFFPQRISMAIGFTLVTLASLFIANDVVARSLLDAADSFFARTDALVSDAVEQPMDPMACGSRSSMVAWNSIGRQGKDFIANGPQRQDVADFLDRTVERPIRVYVGLRSRSTMKQRAVLALEELKRVGGFDRSLLVVATPTGTGWLDPSAVNTLEYLHGGDTAIVSMQYSYLPSWITIMVDPRRSIESADALFDEIYSYWKTLPKDSRPRLYLHGLSLGSLGSERSADLFKIFEDPIDGSVWSGPPFPSRNWNSAVRNRNADSSPWLPTFRDGRLLRFTAQKNAIDPDQPWGPMRNIYIQHASDPMVWFSPDLAWTSPEWLSEPRGPDVSPHLRWYPIVTFLQAAFDIPMATTVPLGYGHNYSPSSYIDAWIAVTTPSDWNDAMTERLKAQFDSVETPKP